MSTGQKMQNKKREKYRHVCGTNTIVVVVRSGSEETVDTVVAVSSAKKQQHTEAENR